MARVLLVDDDDAVRRSLRLALRFEADLDVVAETSTAAAATRAAGELQPDIILLDLGLPDLAGRELLTAVRRASPRSRVVVFSGHEPDDEDYWTRHTAAYVTKGGEAQQLLDVLRQEAARHLGPGPGHPSDVSWGRPAAGGTAQVDQPAMCFEASIDSVPAARAFVRAHLERWQVLTDDAALVVTELATNAVTHAGTEFWVRLSRSATAVRIEVHDGSDSTPEPQPWSDTAEHGRGIVLVSVVTDAWGIEPSPGGGKTIWAELPVGHAG